MFICSMNCEIGKWIAGTCEDSIKGSMLLFLSLE